MARKVGSFVPSVEQAQMDEILQAAAEDAQEESAPEDAVVVSAVKKGKRPAVDEPEDEEDEEEEEDALPGGEKVKEKVKHPNKRNATSTGRRKIAIEYIPEKAKRTVSFTKRKAGLMKKAFELSTLTKTQCLLVVVSETGLVYTFATKDFKPLVELPVGRRFISRALNQSDPIYDTLDADAPYDDEEDGDEDELEDTLMKVAPTYRQFPLPNHALPPRPAEPFHFVQNTLVENSNYNGYRPPLPDSSLLPFDLHPTPFIPSPLPIQRSLSNEMHHSPPYTSPYAAPPLLLPHQQTPYERASAEHAGEIIFHHFSSNHLLTLITASFAQYQANAIYAGPKTPIPPPTRSIHGASSFSDDTRALAALHTIGQQSVRTNIEIKADRAPMNLSHATEAISERRAGWVRLAESKLALSKSVRPLRSSPADDSLMRAGVESDDYELHFIFLESRSIEDDRPARRGTDWRAGQLAWFSAARGGSDAGFAATSGERVESCRSGSIPRSSSEITRNEFWSVPVSFWIRQKADECQQDPNWPVDEERIISESISQPSSIISRRTSSSRPPLTSASTP